MTFQELARNYLRQLHQMVLEAQQTGELTPELSFRPPLDGFFRDFATFISTKHDIGVIFEPRNQGRMGRPDWRFYDTKTFGVYGYVEAKGLDFTNAIDVTQHLPQLSKYLELGHQVLLTDGLEFVFFDPHTEGEAASVSLLHKPVHHEDWATSPINPLLENHLRDFFQDAGFRQISERQLISEVAKRARELARSIQALSSLPPGSGLDEAENRTIDALSQLKELIENHHDPTLRDDKSFADFVAQVLMFGLFYSHRVLSQTAESPQERYEKIRLFWNNDTLNHLDEIENLRPFHALTEILGEELTSLGIMGTWYQDCAMLLAHVELQQNQFESPDYHILYEQFLANYDPQARFDYGAFYTPYQLASFTVRLTEAIVSSLFPDRSIYDENNKLIDPCCGTGTFVEQLLISSGNGVKGDLIGFEILPAPYALAHYRLASLSEHIARSNGIEIILTNTLSNELIDEPDLVGESLISAEQAVARAFIQTPLTLVIGNPPSSDSLSRSSGDNFSIIDELMGDFRPPDVARHGRQNIQKQIQNEFMKFLRWSCDKLIDSEIGVFALVLPSSFAEHPSYDSARKWLRKKFHKFWVVDIDADTRTGIRASNLFKVQQGRMLLLGVRDSLKENQPVETYYVSINNKSARQKLEWLDDSYSSAEFLSLFSQFESSEGATTFRPIKEFDQTLYESFWPLYREKNKPANNEQFVFARHCSGLKLAPSSLFLHTSQPVLVRRSREIGDERIDVDDILARWYKGQDKPPKTQKFAPKVRQAFREAFADSNEPIRRYSFRPFFNPPAFISTTVLRTLAKVGGGGTRYRPEVIRAYDAPNTIGFVVAPATRDIGSKLHRFASFCWNLPDNDLCKRGNAHVFCNNFPAYKPRRGEWDNTPIDNVSAKLLTRLNQIRPTTVEEVVYYTFAILCSEAFLDEFEGALFNVANSSKRPRIPFPNDPDLFELIATAGRDLAVLERDDLIIELPQQYQEKLDLFQKPFQMKKFAIDLEDKSLVLFGTQGVEIEINDVPRDVLRFQVAGYQVLQQWLKYHSHRYTRMQFSRDQFVTLISLLFRIQKQIEIVNVLDDNVLMILSDEVGLL